jgi:hypothetical protein
VIPSEGVAFDLDAIGVVERAVKGGVGEGVLAESVVPGNDLPT